MNNEQNMAIQTLPIGIQIPESINNLKLPDRTLLNYYILRENRCFFIDYEIDDNITDIQQEIMLINMVDDDNDIPIEKRTPIKLYIHSPGGDLIRTYSLCNTIINSKTPVWTYNYGDAYSAACLILIAGHKRFAMPFSTAMLHTGSGETGGTYEQTMEQAKIYKKQIDYMGKYILQQTKIDEKTYKKNKNKDWYLDAEEQIKYGIVDEIGL